MDASALQPHEFAPQLLIPARVGRAAARRRTTAWALLAITLAAVGVFVVARSGSEPERYQTAPVERRGITRRVEATGRVDALKRADVPAPFEGRLVRVLVRVGEGVKEGQALAKLDGRASDIALRGAEADAAAASGRIAEATAALSGAVDERKRAERLLARELVSQSELDRARATESKLRAALEAARAERAGAGERLRAAKLTASLSSVTSPMDGVVLKAPETVGSAVGPEGGPLFVIGSDLETLRVDADVTESDVGLLHPGQSAKFSVPAHAGRTFEARVEHVGIDAERTAVAVRYAVRLRAPNPDRLLLPGMTATVRIEVAKVENALAVREAALRFRPNGALGAPRSLVWKVGPQGLASVRVTPGLSDGAFTEIRSDDAGALQPGSEVALGLLTSEPPKSGAGIRLGNR